MSSTTASGTPSPSAVNYALDQALNTLLIGTVWSSFLIPIAIALFFFSDARMRRQPIFILNTCAIALGLAVGAINIYNITRSITGRSVDPSITTVLTAMFFLLPISVQSILLFRVVAIYPPRSMSWKSRVLIYAPFAILLVTRIVNASKCIQGVKLLSSTYQVEQLEWKLPYAKIEWFLQLFYDTYASTLFLVRLRQSRRLFRPQKVDIISTNPPRSTSYASRLGTLWWIAVSNFVFPVMLNIAQIVCIFRDSDFLPGTYILMVNNYIEIIGVLLATLWCSGTHWQGASLSSSKTSGRMVVSHSESSEESVETQLKFASPSVAATYMGAEAV